MTVTAWTELHDDRGTGVKLKNKQRNSVGFAIFVTDVPPLKIFRPVKILAAEVGRAPAHPFWNHSDPLWFFGGCIFSGSILILNFIAQAGTANLQAFIFAKALRQASFLASSN